MGGEWESDVYTTRLTKPSLTLSQAYKPQEMNDRYSSYPPHQPIRMGESTQSPVVMKEPLCDVPVHR